MKFLLVILGIKCFHDDLMNHLHLIRCSLYPFIHLLERDETKGPYVSFAGENTHSRQYILKLSEEG